MSETERKSSENQVRRTKGGHIRTGPWSAAGFGHPQVLRKFLMGRRNDKWRYCIRKAQNVCEKQWVVPFVPSTIY